MGSGFTAGSLTVYEWALILYGLAIVVGIVVIERRRRRSEQAVYELPPSLRADAALVEETAISTKD